MMFRIVAGLNFESMTFDKVLDPTGSPDVMYDRIISLRISRGLSSETVSSRAPIPTFYSIAVRNWSSPELRM